VAVLRQAEMDAMCPATREAQQPTNARFCRDECVIGQITYWQHIYCRQAII